MKIGLFIDTFYPMVDGVIKVVDNYARELTKTDDVTVFCPIINNNDFKDLPYKVVGCPALRIPNVDYELPVPILGQEFRKALKNADLDIVHIHSPFTVGREGLRYAKKKRIPAIISIHSQFDRDIERNVRRNSLFFKIAVNYVTQTYNSVDECFAVNKKTGEHFQTELGLKKNFGVLKNASSILPVKDEKSAYKRVNDAFNIGENETVFAFVGRIDLIKNLMFLLDALYRLKQKNVPFKMLFVGDGHDKAAIEERTKELGLDKDAIFCGKVLDSEMLASIYARAKLILFPSLYDSSSLIQVEAASQGTPTLFLKGSITSSTTIDNVNAFWAENDPQAFADRIAEILGDEELYKKVSEGAKRDLFITWEDAVKNVREIYMQAIERAKKKKK